MSSQPCPGRPEELSTSERSSTKCASSRSIVPASVEDPGPSPPVDRTPSKLRPDKGQLDYLTASQGRTLFGTQPATAQLELEDDGPEARASHSSSQAPLLPVATAHAAQRTSPLVSLAPLPSTSAHEDERNDCSLQASDQVNRALAGTSAAALFLSASASAPPSSDPKAALRAQLEQALVANGKLTRQLEEVKAQNATLAIAASAEIAALKVELAAARAQLGSAGGASTGGSGPYSEARSVGVALESKQPDQESSETRTEQDEDATVVQDLHKHIPVDGPFLRLSEPPSLSGIVAPAASAAVQTQTTDHRDAALMLVLPYLTLHELVMLAGANYIRLVCTMDEVWSRRLYLNLSDRVRFRQLFCSRKVKWRSSRVAPSLTLSSLGSVSLVINKGNHRPFPKYLLHRLRSKPAGSTSFMKINVRGAVDVLIRSDSCAPKQPLELDQSEAWFIVNYFRPVVHRFVLLRPSADPHSTFPPVLRLDLRVTNPGRLAFLHLVPSFVGPGPPATSTQANVHVVLEGVDHLINNPLDADVFMRKILGLARGMTGRPGGGAPLPVKQPTVWVPANKRNMLYAAKQRHRLQDELRVTTAVALKVHQPDSLIDLIKSEVVQRTKGCHKESESHWTQADAPAILGLHAQAAADARATARLQLFAAELPFANLNFVDDAVELFYLAQSFATDEDSRGPIHKRLQRARALVEELGRSTAFRATRPVVPDLNTVKTTFPRAFPGVVIDHLTQVVPLHDLTSLARLNFDYFRYSMVQLRLRDIDLDASNAYQLPQLFCSRTLAESDCRARVSPLLFLKKFKLVTIQLNAADSFGSLVGRTVLFCDRKQVRSDRGSHSIFFVNTEVLTAVCRYTNGDVNNDGSVWLHSRAADILRRSSPRLLHLRGERSQRDPIVASSSLPLVCSASRAKCCGCSENTTSAYRPSSARVSCPGSNSRGMPPSPPPRPSPAPQGWSLSSNASGGSPTSPQRRRRSRRFLRPPLLGTIAQVNPPSAASACSSPRNSGWRRPRLTASSRQPREPCLRTRAPALRSGSPQAGGTTWLHRMTDYVRHSGSTSLHRSPTNRQSSQATPNEPPTHPASSATLTAIPNEDLYRDWQDGVSADKQGGAEGGAEGGLVQLSATEDD